MCGKSLLTLFVFLFVNTCLVFAQESIQISQSKILSLIDAGNYASAESAANKMAKNFAGNKDITMRIWQIAHRYDKVEAFKYAKKFCEKIIADYPKDEYATYAALLSAKLNAYDLIDAGKYESAKAAALEMMKNSSGHQQAARRTWEIANRLDKFRAYEHSKALCTQIAQNYPGDEYASYAKLQLAKLEVYKLIDANNYEAAETATSEMIKDFATHKEAARRLYETAHKYENKGLYTYAANLYGRIAAGWPKDSYGVRADFMHKITSESILTDNKIDDANTAVEKLKNDFEQNRTITAKMPQAMLNIAEMFYEKAASESTERKYADQWRQLSIKLLEQYVVSKASGPTLTTGYYLLGSNYYAKASLTSLEGNTEERKVFYKKAIEVWERLINKFGDSRLAPQTYFSCGVCYAQELGEYQKGVDYFQKVVNNWPDFENAKQVKILIAEYTYKIENTK